MSASFSEMDDQVLRDHPEGDRVLLKVKLLHEIWNKREELRDDKSRLSEALHGTIHEVEQAEKTLGRSLNNISKELKLGEIEQAREAGAITEQDATSIRKIKTLLEREAELLQRLDPENERDDHER